MTAFYNEVDPKAAAWLRELIKRDLIAPGVVDERSIEDVSPTELDGFTQCHFFAGIGVWSYALRQAGWPDDRPVWTGSCPCQPFSSAGQGAGFDDERHLWPALHWLVEKCRPIVCFGEQVAGSDGLAWLDLVSDDLEGIGYSCGAAVTAACGFGAPHQRRRLYWVADADQGKRGRITDGQECEPNGAKAGRQQSDSESESDSEAGGVADANSERARRDSGGFLGPKRKGGDQPDNNGSELCGRARELADTTVERLQRGQPLQDKTRPPSRLRSERQSSSGRPNPSNGFWRDADWLGCTDGKFRPVEPSTFPLADRATERVGRLRGYGNAIVAPQAQAFIESYLETKGTK